MIKCLDLETISRLRGGVVIDSPEAAIRQLVQNAMDASARHVTIKIHLETLSVCVEDDGEGIDEADMENLGKAYYTSKSSGGGSFGYRGEALAAIASCSSSMVIASKREAGSRWSTKSLDKRENSSTGVLCDFFEPSFGDHGTAVMVSRLLGSFPVRWELSRLNEPKMLDNLRRCLFEDLIGNRDVHLEVYIIDSLAPDLRFSKIVNSNLGALVTELYASFFEKINFDKYEFTNRLAIVQIWLSREPSIAKTRQFVVLNSRPFSLPARERRSISALLSSAKYSTAKGYIGRSMKTYPRYIVLIDWKVTDREEVGLPASHAFSSQKEISELIMESIRSTMSLGSPGHLKRESATEKAIDTPISSGLSTPNRISTPASLTASPESSLPLPVLSQVTTKIFLNHYHIVNQVAQRFILLRDLDCLYIVDQHACDERICFEKSLYDYIEDLQDPFIDLRVKCDGIPIQLSESELKKMAQLHKSLQRYGVDFEEGEYAIVLTHLPAVLISRSKETDSLKTFLLSFAEFHQDDLEKRDPQDWLQIIPKLPRAIREAFISKACKQAIKFGFPLTHSEMAHLIDELSKCRVFTQCAHGRPTMVPVGEVSSIDVKSFDEDLIL